MQHLMALSIGRQEQKRAYLLCSTKGKNQKMERNMQIYRPQERHWKNSRDKEGERYFCDVLSITVLRLNGCQEIMRIGYISGSFCLEGPETTCDSLKGHGRKTTITSYYQQPWDLGVIWDGCDTQGGPGKILHHRNLETIQIKLIS